MKVNANNIKSLEVFIAQNTEADLLKIDLLNSEVVAGLNWKGFEKTKKNTLDLLKAYQRLIRIIPAEHSQVIFSLLKKEVHSSLQIASISKGKFLKQYSAIFQNDRELIENTYNNALAVRSKILIQHMEGLQNAEPHYRACNIS